MPVMLRLQEARDARHAGQRIHVHAVDRHRRGSGVLVQPKESMATCTCQQSEHTFAANAYILNKWPHTAPDKRHKLH